MTRSRLLQACGRLAQTEATPFYLFDLDRIAQKFVALKSAWGDFFPQIRVAYSYKTNSLKAITTGFKQLGACADIVSGTELHLALADGFSPQDIFFNGPVKTEDELRQALRMGVYLNVDSLDEVRSLIDLCRKGHYSEPRIGVRLSGAYRGHASRFGMISSEFQLAMEILKEAGIRLGVIHFHIGANIQNTGVYVAMLKQYRELITQLLAEKEDAIIDIGGGFPAITASASSVPISPSAFAEDIALAFDEMGVNRKEMHLVIEPGRCLVEDEGCVVSRVMTIKERAKCPIVTIDAGIHLIRSLHTWFHRVGFVRPARTSRDYSVYGCNCFESDLIAQGINGPDDLTVNDLVIIEGAGGYDFASASTWTRTAPAVFGSREGEITLLLRARQPSLQLRQNELDESLPAMARELPVDSDLKLRTLTSEDAEELARLIDGNRLYLRRWLAWVDYSKNASDSQNFIEIEEHARLLRERLAFGIRFKNYLVGMLSFHQIDWANGQAAIGYWLAEAYQGRNIVRKSCRVLIEYGFGVLELERIVIRCAVDNQRSRAVAERLGFCLEGIAARSEKINGAFLDQALYAITREQWGQAASVA